MLTTTFENLELYAGASWGWTESLSDYPASLYALKLAIKKGTSDPLVINGTANGDDFEFALSFEDSAALDEGDYYYQFITSKLSDDSIKIIKNGSKYIGALLKSGDQRTYWEQVRDNCKDALKILSSREVSAVTILGRSYTYLETEKIVALMERADRKLQLESGKINGNSRTYKLRWTN